MQCVRIYVVICMSSRQCLLGSGGSKIRAAVAVRVQEHADWKMWPHPGNRWACSAATGWGDVTNDISDALIPSTTSSRASTTGRSSRGMLSGADSQDHRPRTCGISAGTPTPSSGVSTFVALEVRVCTSEGSGGVRTHRAAPTTVLQPSVCC